MKSTIEQARQALRDAAMDLFDEVCRTDGVPVSDDHRQNLVLTVESLLRETPVNWQALGERYSAEELREQFRSHFAPELRSLITAHRPS